ncbi:copper amine oxidase N-terminal domain-containing protein [Cellulosilyticum sp. I15G10I2]|uniref:copper amine oxidase N-terminal domain-containing protein n=1 Tax=Cellulosilyticum sp. I15G10I2 TaxID=1892843 RepID=UPI00085CBF94|nr:copper amine oxidase N-terminal domain-containing protein [Cellulosilyticum sp. I15G10I2]
MKFKKLLTGFLPVAILSALAVTSFASFSDTIVLDNTSLPIESAIPISAPLDTIKHSHFNSFTGVVKELAAYPAIKGSIIVSVENDEGIPANIIISENTYIIGDAEITKGATITGFYDATRPMILIYPAQYNAEVVVVGTPEQTIKVDVFDKDLVSADGLLKLNISKDTEIISHDGKPFEGELASRKLAVLYGISTKSLPAQTTPSKVIVLFEEPEPVLPTSDAISDLELLINDKKIASPAVYTNDLNTLMVPLRAISEAVGFEVSWEERSKTIRVGKGISLAIDEDYYTYMKTAPIQLGTAPELVENTTFVPLSFFKDVMRLDHADIFGSQVVISGKIIN